MAQPRAWHMMDHKYWLKLASCFGIGKLRLEPCASCFQRRWLPEVAAPRRFRKKFTPSWFLGASESKQRSKIWISPSRDLKAPKESLCLPRAKVHSWWQCQEKYLCLGEQRLHMKEEQEEWCLHIPQASSLHPFPAKLKSSSWISIMVKSFIYKNCCCRWVTPYKTMPGTL